MSTKIERKSIEFYKHNIDEECIAEFNSVAKNLFITTGPKTAEFEKSFADYLGMPFCVGVMSCSHALHLSYRALGIGEGDEVIVPAFTFVATATAVMHAGAKPVFADVDYRTGLLDPDKTEAAITEKTKAICPVHMYGVMAPMRRLSKIAEKYGLKLVEDAAHCIEGRGPDFGPGSLSDSATFSFYATKNITCGEGGAVVTRSRDIAEKIRTLRNHGMTKSAVERHGTKIPEYDVKQIGFKSNLTDLQSALLIPQLNRIKKRLSRREAIVKRYNNGLSDIKSITLPVIPHGYKSAYHLYTILVAPPEKRDEFMTALMESGVNCSINFRPLSHFTLFREKFGMNGKDYPAATRMGYSTVTLPLYPSLENEEVEYIIETVITAAGEILSG